MSRTEMATARLLIFAQSLLVAAVVATVGVVVAFCAAKLRYGHGFGIGKATAAWVLTVLVLGIVLWGIKCYNSTYELASLNSDLRTMLFVAAWVVLFPLMLGWLVWHCRHELSSFIKKGPATT